MDRLRGPEHDHERRAFVGDRGFTMLVGEFAECVKYNLPAQSLARGTPNRKKIALTVAADKVRELG